MREVDSVEVLVQVSDYDLSSSVKTVHEDFAHKYARGSRRISTHNTGL